MVTIIIPSKTEKFLKKTIEDVLIKATGEIEVLPVLDGYWPPEEEIVKDSRVRYIHMEPSQKTQKRHGINRAVNEAKGDYVMSVDAHIMFAPGFDEQLVKDHNPNWIQVPRSLGPGFQELSKIKRSSKGAGFGRPGYQRKTAKRVSPIKTHPTNA